MRYITFNLFALIICVAGFACPALAEKRVALVIGNSSYKSLQVLANPKNDASLMARTLKGLGFEVITARDADRTAIGRAIRNFGRALRAGGKDAVGLFYFAGHGVQARGVNYLIPLGAEIRDEADLDIEAISTADVLSQMETAGNALNLIILDACRNNPFKGRLRSASRGLARIQAVSGSLVAFAAAPGQAAEDGRGANSPYTLALTRAMQVPGLAVEQVFKRTRVSVEAQTGRRQTPWEESSLRGDFYFTPATSTTTAGPATNPIPKLKDTGALEAGRIWATIKDTGNIRVLEAFEKRYHQSFHATLARERIIALKRIKLAVGVFPTRPEPAPAQKRGVKPGDNFRDCAVCPEMVVLPAGSFMMGAPRDEKGRFKSEGPQHTVTIGKNIAVGKFEITFTQWKACVADGGCWGYQPEDQGWGRGKRPVINVSWSDTEGYLTWLSKKTGFTYRLLSEAEWEYAARAGTKTPFSTGDTITAAQANFNGRHTYNGSRKGRYSEKTATVGSFAANAFGLYDMYGNVAEWTQDCAHKSYAGAPENGAAWTRGGECWSRVMRGGSWKSPPKGLRSADRGLWVTNSQRASSFGFRVARMLGP